MGPMRKLCLLALLVLLNLCMPLLVLEWAYLSFSLPYPVSCR